MDVTVYSYPSGDPVLIDKIVNEFLSQGKFDKLRKECMADADTKPAYQNLQQRVESTVSQFLKKQLWRPDLNKNQLRDSLRKHILESGFLDAGINRIVDQIVNPNVLATVFMPEVEEVVYSYLSIPRPGDRYPKQTEPSIRNSGDTNSKQSEVTPLDSYKDQKTHKTEDTSSVSDDLKTETCEITRSKTPDTLPPIVPAAHAQVENGPREMENEIKQEEDNNVLNQCGNCGVKDEEKPGVTSQDGVSSSSKIVTDKVEPPSDESQESLSRMGVERLRISESDGVNAPDSDASLPLEINEKSMSGSRDSEDFIINKMSPISQGRLTPEEVTSTVEEEKKPLTFIGRIPKLKRDDSESSKSSKKEEKGERPFAKGVYSSDESDSSKQSVGKSDSEDKKLKEGSDKKPKVEEPREKSEKKYKENDDKKRKSDHHRSHSKDRKSRDDKSRSSREEKDKSHSRSRDDKSREKERKSSSHSRSKSSSHHKSMHKHDREHHRDDSKSRDKDRSRHDKRERDKRDSDRKKREDEKRKKSKSVDDHGKERYRRDDRRSTDRDSNERDRAKDTSSNRIQSDGKKREREQRADDSKKGRSQKEESGEKEGAMKEATETSPLEHGNERAVHGEAASEPPVLNTAAVSREGTDPSVSGEVTNEKRLDVKFLTEKGALTVVKFPRVVDDFYVKFNSTGFQYFEDWETTKLDCEREFKDFIDEAGKDLSLLSDEESDHESYHDHKNSEARRREIVSNSLRGLTNFANGLIFDPVTYEFYKWTNRKFYEEYARKKGERPGETEGFPGGVKMMDEYETAEKNKENRGRDKKVRKSLKLLSRYQRKMDLKLKYGKEQHRFVRRRKKRYWTADANGFKMREWNNGNPGRSEDPRECVIKKDSKYLQSPRVLLLDSPAEEVLKECHDLVNHGESSGDTSIDDLIFEDGKNGETSSSKCKTDESSNHSSASVPKMDVEAKIRLYQIQALRRNKGDSCPQKTCILARISSGSKGDIDYEEGSDNLNGSELAISHLSKKMKKRRIRIGLSRARLKRDVDLAVKSMDVQKNYNLPLSPESDDSLLNSNGVMPQKKNPRKRAGDEYSIPVSVEIPMKKLKEKRVIRQKYDSQDLYKPRPFSIGSKSRGRALRAEEK